MHKFQQFVSRPKQGRFIGWPIDRQSEDKKVWEVFTLSVHTSSSSQTQTEASSSHSYRILTHAVLLRQLYKIDAGSLHLASLVESSSTQEVVSSSVKVGIAMSSKIYAVKCVYNWDELSNHYHITHGNC